MTDWRDRSSLHHLPLATNCVACTAYEQLLYDRHMHHRSRYACIWSCISYGASPYTNAYEHLAGITCWAVIAIVALVFAAWMVPGARAISQVDCYTTHIKVTMTTCGAAGGVPCLQASHHLQWIGTLRKDNKPPIDRIMGYDVNDNTCLLSSPLCSPNSTSLLANSVKWLGVHETCYISRMDGTWRDASQVYINFVASSWYIVIGVSITAIPIFIALCMTRWCPDVMVEEWQQYISNTRLQSRYIAAHRHHSSPVLYHDLRMLCWCASSRHAAFNRLHHGSGEPLLRHIASYLNHDWAHPTIPPLDRHMHRINIRP